MKKFFVMVFGIFALSLSLYVCAGAEGNTIRAEYAVAENEEFESVNLLVSIEDFDKEGFMLGDSLDVVFSNGFVLEDIPYYNGYYVNSGMPLVVSYPGEANVIVAANNLSAFFDSCGLTEGDTAAVSLRERGKYLTVQEALATVYTDEWADYGDDVVFANFRELSGGAIKEKTFYRGASPIDNLHQRAAVADRLIRKAGINFVLNLSDNEESVRKHLETNNAAKDFLFTELLENGHAILLHLTPGFSSEEFRDTLTGGLREMMRHDGPYYIHCVEGKDRTGFVCILLEALAGASYSEIEQDYMTTYDNFYGISKESALEKYNAFKEIRLNDMIYYLSGTNAGEDLSLVDLSVGAKKYLQDGGMSEEEIKALIVFLTE